MILVKNFNESNSFKVLPYDLKVFLIPIGRTGHQVPNGLDSIDWQCFIFQVIFEAKGNHADSMFDELSRNTKHFDPASHFHLVEDSATSNQAMRKVHPGILWVVN